MKSLHLLAAMSFTSASLPAAEPAPDFVREVAPILAGHCIRCHQPSHRSGELSLTTPGDLAELEYVVPGKPEKSFLLEAVSPPAQGNLPPAMPKEGTRLTGEQVGVLRRWIAAGAPWPEGFVVREQAKAGKDWWSLQPLAAVEPPVLPAAEARRGEVDWSTNPVDRFVMAKLRDAKLEPSPPADRTTLLRRLKYDLLGLPPTPEEIAEFVADASPTAYEDRVEKYLASPHYGERWGRHWLDVVRFGESRGYERNQIIDNLWPFRDYVIRSFNEDKPFDRLIREHLAGDALEPDRPEVVVGSAFLTAGPYDDVGNQDPVAAAQIRADTIDEMIRTTGEAFLGLTIGCARCHNHKFDPVATADYYAWHATFAGVFHGERPVTTAADKRVRAERLRPLEAERERLNAARAELDKQIVARAAAAEAEAAKSWTRPPLSRFGTEESFGPVTAKFVRLIVDGTDAPAGGQSFRLDEFEVWTDEDRPRNVALASAGGRARGATARQAQDFEGAYGPELVIDGRFGERWQGAGNELIVEFARPERIRRVLFSSDRTKALAEGYPLTTFVGDYRLEISEDGKAWTPVADSSDRKPVTEFRKTARLRTRVALPEDAVRRQEIDRKLAEVDAELRKLPAPPVWWIGTRKPAPGPFVTFVGGDPQKPGETVVAASPSAFEGTVPAYRLDPSEPEAKRRLALADWLNAPENPLPPRVLANRIWHHHFGCGLVDTPSDFGYLGGRPSHPELLDFLARRLLADGRKLKPLHRLLTTSQTYRQSSAHRPDAARIDGDSRLLWRYPPRRLSAEEMRDSLLAVAGKLDPRQGGPGFRLYTYQQDNVATYVPLDRPGPETYRRAVYHQNARSAPVDLLSEFDCPDNAFAAPRRAATTTPMQALTMLNQPFALDMAGHFADRLTREHPEDVPGQIRRAFRLAFGRDPSPSEAAAARSVAERAGLKAVCRALFNSNEFAFVR